MMNNVVPVIITCDVDPSPEVSLQGKRDAIGLTMDLLESFGIRSTFFFVSKIAQMLKKEVPRLVLRNHEIACHGLTHSYEEEYDKLPEDLQRKNLTHATTILEDLTGQSIKSFRGPRVKTSHITHKILEELNYLADCSVCSQRIDLLSSNLINRRWILAPRVPYHPSERNAFRRGTRKIVVVPVSALVLPFISGVLYVLGPFLMKRLLDILYLESKKTGKPIVYLLHPVEFVRQTGEIVHNLSLDRIRSEGFYFRKRLKAWRDERKRLAYTKELFEHMKKLPGTSFMTVDEYLATRWHGD